MTLYVETSALLSWLFGEPEGSKVAEAIDCQRCWSSSISTETSPCCPTTSEFAETRRHWGSRCDSEIELQTKLFDPAMTTYRACEAWTGRT